MENKKSIIAIMGPSGAGKTTLGHLLASRQNFSIPIHCTTRKSRPDDEPGFYKYLSHDEYRNLYESNKFLITSGDGPEIKEKFGNFYGVLKNDCIKAWNKSDIIILFVSYKDIQTLIQLNNQDYNVDIVNLTFNDIENGIKTRIENDVKRNHTSEDVRKRVISALDDTEKYGKALRMYAKAIIYTDQLGIEETYQKVCLDLNLRR